MILPAILVALFGSAPAQAREAPAPPTPSPSPSASPEPTVEDLYRAIMPRPIGNPEELATVEVATTAPGTTTRESRAEETESGFHLGRVRIEPSIHALYVQAEGALLDTATPVEDRYYEIRPQVGAEAPVSTGFVRGSYQARIRRGSSFELVESTVTHLADLSLDIPMGGVEINAGEHFSRGVLETTEVDPGREYFFRLGRFTRHRHSLGLRFVPGGRADIGVAGNIDTVRVEDEAAFFDHEQQAASGQVGYELRPGLRAGIAYGFTRIPPSPERPLIASHLHSVSGELRGEMLPLTTGTLSVGYTRRTSTRPGAGNARFEGLTASGRLEKSFTPSTTLILSGGRATHVSGFEENPFYVANAAEVLLRAGLPGSVAMEAGAGYHRNRYPTVSTSIGASRRDAIRGWSLGLGRPVTRYAFLRADYRRDRRSSNIESFVSHSSALTVQLGLGLFPARVR